MEYVVLIVIILIPLLYFINFISNSHPLSNEEIIELSLLRRFNEIIRYYGFAPYDINVNKEFKSSLNAIGANYYLNEDVEYFPSIAAQLLKGKKHEWVIYAFVNEKKVVGMWTNKGQDNKAVSPTISMYEIKQNTMSYKANTIIEFHNHTNAVLSPSDLDINHANDFGKYFTNEGINYLPFIVGRGQYNQYGWWISKKLLDIETNYNSIIKDNGLSKSLNYQMRKEIKKKTQFKNSILNSSRTSHNFVNNTIKSKIKSGDIMLNKVLNLFNINFKEYPTSNCKFNEKDNKYSCKLDKKELDLFDELDFIDHSGKNKTFIFKSKEYVESDIRKIVNTLYNILGEDDSARGKYNDVENDEIYFQGFWIGRVWGIVLDNKFCVMCHIDDHQFELVIKT